MSRLSVVLMFGLAACSPPNPKTSSAVFQSPAFAAPSQLTARLVDPLNADLNWKNNATEPGGFFVEFNIGEETGFTMLGAVWADTPAFRHSNVAPETKFNYRIRPFFGCTSRTAEVATDGSMPITPGARLKSDHLATPHPDAEGPLEDVSWAAAPDGGTIAKRSIRTNASAAEGAPANLTAVLSSPTGVDLRWQDRATDEDGYLVEVSTDRKAFKLCALLPSDATSFRKTMLPPHTKYYFRVRAFFYGMPSAVASVTTGPDAARKSGGPRGI